MCMLVRWLVQLFEILRLFDGFCGDKGLFVFFGLHYHLLSKRRIAFP